jgi:hypothetical protein
MVGLAPVWAAVVVFILQISRSRDPVDRGSI